LTLLDFLCEILQDCVFNALNWTRFLAPQSRIVWISWDKEICIALRLVSRSWLETGLVKLKLECRVLSSAKLWIGLLVAERRSFICNKKSVGATTEPWGTPALIV
jgi:hypothetical protein